MAAIKIDPMGKWMRAIESNGKMMKRRDRISPMRVIVTKMNSKIK
jgi:hypothetical protein